LIELTNTLTRLIIGISKNNFVRLKNKNPVHGVFVFILLTRHLLQWYDPSIVQICFCSVSVLFNTTIRGEGQEMGRKIIGLAGLPGCGKGTFVRYFRERLGDDVLAISTSSIIRPMLVAQGLPFNRPNCAAIVRALRNESHFGQTWLTDAARRLMDASDASIIILDSVRLESDFRLVVEEKDGIVVYLEATPWNRWQRRRIACEKDGEGELTFDQFKRQDDDPLEHYARDVVINRAHFKINNNGGQDDLTPQLNRLVSSLVA